MVRLGLMGLAVILGLSACDENQGGGGSGVEPSAACGLSRGRVAAHLNHPESTLVPGTYRLELVDHIVDRGGQSVVVTETVEISDRGQFRHSAEVVCPRDGRLQGGGSVEEVQMEASSIPVDLKINWQSATELPDPLQTIGIRMTLANGRVAVRLRDIQSASLAKLGISKDEFQNNPRVRVQAVDGGIVLTLTEEIEDSGKVGYQAFFRFIEAAPVPQPPPPPPENFTKEQCLARTGVRLGRASLRTISFSPNCSHLYVTHGIPSITLERIHFLPATKSWACVDVGDKVRVMLVFDTGGPATTNELISLNPGFPISMRAFGTEGVRASFVLENSSGLMRVPHASGRLDPESPSLSRIVFHGTVTGVIDLSREFACQNYDLLNDYQNRRQEALDLMIREFQIQMQ